MLQSLHQGPLLRRTSAYENLTQYAPIDCATLACALPAPVRIIDSPANLPEYKMAEICLKVREIIISQNLGENTIDAEWENFFSESSHLTNKSCLFSSWVNRCFSEPSKIKFYQTNEVFADDNTFPAHVFVTAEIEKTTFLVDLAFRRFIDKRLILSDIDEAVVNHLLKYGFVECTEENLDVYRRLLQAANQHQDKQECWRLSYDKLKPISLEKF